MKGHKEFDFNCAWKDKYGEISVNCDWKDIDMGSNLSDLKGQVWWNLC